MLPIERALVEIRTLHEQITDSPAPKIPSRALEPFPPGADPVAYALEEVETLKRAIGHSQLAPDPLEATPPPRSEPAWTPPSTVLASDEAFRILVEVPGIPASDVRLTVEDAHLVLRGRRQPPNKGALQPMLIEQAYGGFERRFALPPWFQPGNVRARCRNGILEIEAYKEESGERT
jgi:HSP20 family molecular chaperone IbpA